ncbi:scarecrow-like protein 8 [Sesamum indicum]|uniref:Scarecrow-like protein 8 n=1 Tax=Sesamum indicum TaxID=4182 RepID=A0A6I9TGF9_SESIN|nr:scarecrow-like protein 8 [Sesamum indicum]
MSSGFSGGGPDFFAAGGRATSMNGGYNTNLNPQQQFSLRSLIAGILPDPAAQIRRPQLIGKRSLSEFQQNQQGSGFYLRNVKSRVNYQHATPISPFSTVEFSPVPSILPEASSVSNSMISRYGLPICQPHRLQPLTSSNRNVNNVCLNSGTTLPGLGSEVLRQDSEKKMMNHRLQELEKELLGEEEDGEAVSVVTNSEWSETIQDLISPIRKPISPSPTSSSSSCSSTSASPPIPCSKQSLIDAAVAVSEGKLEVAAGILTRLQQVANPRGSSEQRVTAHMVSALKSRVNPTEQHRLPVGDLYTKEHALSIQMLYDVSPCFKLGFMAANLAILEATWDQGFNKVHVVDFDIGRGGQYMHLLHALVAKKPADKRAAAVALKITTFTDSVPGDEHRLKMVGEGLKALASKIGVCLTFSVKNSTTTDLSRDNLGVDQDEALAVNFAFKLYKLADESVTTENPRDELLRRVKGLSPTVTTVVEQDMNANTAPLTARVRETCEYYGALFESLEATVSRENPDRVRVEEALGRKMGNSVACEGRDRVERCEVLGKWRARMSMAGFQPLPMGQPVAESLRVKLNSGTRGNPGFTVSDQSGGICFGWMGRTLTVASAWR